MTKVAKEEIISRKKLPFIGSDLQCRINPRMNFAHYHPTQKKTMSYLRLVYHK